MFLVKPKDTQKKWVITGGSANAVFARNVGVEYNYVTL